jgi:uncharacterized lipoprotein YddW (UPF0748 family)
MKRRNTAWLGCALFALALGCIATHARADEFRALWADAFHAGFRSSSEVSQLVADARAGHFNAVIVEVRKRGDAYYNSLFEPKATDVSPQSYDPLADLIAKAHNTDNGPRIEVHCWIVTYPIWQSATTAPSQPNHPFNLHPEWLSKTESGTNYVSNENYQLDPGHPGVQEHNFNVCMDLISRYDLDGLNFDYVRYPGNTWGYNEVALARYNARFGFTGRPAPTKPEWLQWRRDQVSALVRKVYLNAIVLKPHVKISADTICFAPGVTTDTSWTNSAAAYTSVLQDWRSWMEEGILDISIPMAYFDQGGQYAPAWTNWNRFAKDHRYNRHTVIGPGIYLNSISNALFQMRYTRLPSPAGKYADGVCGYSYAMPTDPAEGSLSRSTFLAALTQTNTSWLYDPNPVPLFPSPTNPPAMPWKSSPTGGHLKGFVFNGTNGTGLDGATVTLTGPTNRVLSTDATGFYGAVDLPAGDYFVSASSPGFTSRSTNLSVSVGLVTTRDLALPPASVPPPSAISNVNAVVGARSAIIVWTTTNLGTSQVEFGLTTNLGAATPFDASLTRNHSVLLSGLDFNTSYFFSVASASGTNLTRSGGWSFATAGELILDNTDATFTGSWTPGAASTDKYGPDYRFAGTSTNGVTASAYFTPDITVQGNYDVFVWHPQGGNRSTNTPVTVVYKNGVVGTRINQEINGGQWFQVGTNLPFLRGTNGFVRISNATSDEGQVVMADAVRFIYRAEQDAPSGLSVPDWWAFHYFGANTNALADHDGDGYTDWAEYLLGTVPTNSASRLSFELAGTEGQTLRATFSPIQAGRFYRMEQKLEPSGWLTLSNSPLPGPNGAASFTLTNEFDSIRVLRLKADWAP